MSFFKTKYDLYWDGDVAIPAGSHVEIIGFRPESGSGYVMTRYKDIRFDIGIDAYHFIIDSHKDPIRGVNI